MVRCPTAADAFGAPGELVRGRLGERNELLQGFRRDGGIDAHRDRHGAEIGDRREILHHIVLHAHQHRRDDEQRRIDQQRVAVRRASRHLHGADRAAGAGDVLDDERLPKLFLEELRHRARDDVGQAAGRRGHHHAHRPRWILLRGGAAVAMQHVVMRQKQPSPNIVSSPRMSLRPRAAAITSLLVEPMLSTVLAMLGSASPRHRNETMSGIDLDGTVVAMTGASVGLGRSMSLALASAGARVVLAAPEIDLLEAVAAEIDAAAGPGRALAVRTDITVRGDCERLVAESIRRFGTTARAGQQCAPSGARSGPSAGGKFSAVLGVESGHLAGVGARQRQRHVPDVARGRAAPHPQRLGPDRQHQHQPRRPVAKPQLALWRHQGGAQIRDADLRRRSGRHRRHRQFAAAGRGVRHRSQQAARSEPQASAGRHHESGDRLARLEALRRQDRRPLYRPALERQACRRTRRPPARARRPCFGAGD